MLNGQFCPKKHLDFRRAQSCLNFRDIQARRRGIWPFSTGVQRQGLSLSELMCVLPWRPEQMSKAIAFCHFIDHKPFLRLCTLKGFFSPPAPLKYAYVCHKWIDISHIRMWSFLFVLFLCSLIRVSQCLEMFFNTLLFYISSFCVHVCMCVRVHACVRVCMHACVRVCMHACVHVCTWTHARTPQRTKGNGAFQIPIDN